MRDFLQTQTKTPTTKNLKATSKVCFCSSLFNVQYLIDKRVSLKTLCARVRTAIAGIARMDFLII